MQALGAWKDYKIKRNDAKAAYLQAYLESKNGVVTWVALPRNRWPASWEGKYENPVVPLVLALYGHPESGGHWERHCETRVKPIGFEPVPSWPSVFWHPQKQALLVIYVDDFALAAKETDHDELWTKLRAAINIGKETEVSLPRMHPFSAVAEQVMLVLQNHPV